MARRTPKYAQALQLGEELGASPYFGREQLYAWLGSCGYSWDGSEWAQRGKLEALRTAGSIFQKPDGESTGILEMRIIGDDATLHQALIELKNHFNLLKVSEPYEDHKQPAKRIHIIIQLMTRKG